MKKILITLGLVLSMLTPGLAFASGTISITPSSGTCSTSVAISYSGTAATPWFYFYNGNDHSFIGSYRHTSIATGDLNSLILRQGGAACGNLETGGGSVLVVVNDADGVAGGVGACESSYASCSGGGYIDASASFTYAAPPPPPPSGLSGEISAAQAGMASTTGFSIGGLVSWVGTNLLEVFIGSGVAVIFNLRYWIVAILIISGVVLFAFRGFRFFRH